MNTPRRALSGFFRKSAIRELRPEGGRGQRWTKRAPRRSARSAWVLFDSWRIIVWNQGRVGNSLSRLLEALGAGQRAGRAHNKEEAEGALRYLNRAPRRYSGLRRNDFRWRPKIQEHVVAARNIHLRTVADRIDAGMARYFFEQARLSDPFEKPTLPPVIRDQFGAVLNAR